jgi:hypothetical protein
LIHHLIKTQTPHRHAHYLSTGRIHKASQNHPQGNPPRIQYEAIYFSAEHAETAEMSWIIQQELTTKNTKATKGDENNYEDSFVRFVSFVVKLILCCGRRLRCVLWDLRDERLHRKSAPCRSLPCITNSGMGCIKILEWL